MDTTIDAILGGSEGATTVEAATPSATTTATPSTENQATSTGEPAKAETDTGTPPVEKAKQEKTEADKAFATLRRELKEAKREREALQAQISKFNAPQEQIDPVADPEGFTQSLDQRYAKELSDRVIALSRVGMLEKHSDYEDMEELFVGLAEQNPALARQMRQSESPAKFAYEYAKQHKAREEIGDPIQYGEKIRQETIQKTMAEIDKLVEAKVKERLGGILPTSLADVQTQGGRVSNPNGFNGPTPLADILKSK